MKLEDQVCSLELAKKLKELGVKQESYFYWVEWGTDKALRVFHGEIRTAEPITRIASAYTVAELGEMLPKKLENHYKVKTMYPFKKGGVVWLRCYFNERSSEAGVSYNGYMNLKNKEYDSEQYWHGELADTEADARAKMLIYLIENNLCQPS
jgi:hypothetical protein